MLPSGELMRASQPLEATLGIHPTLLLRNALPYSMDVIIWQARDPLLRELGTCLGLVPVLCRVAWQASLQLHGSQDQIRLLASAGGALQLLQDCTAPCCCTCPTQRHACKVLTI